MATDDCQLHWRSESVAEIMRRHKITDRRDLAEKISQPYSTVCENLATDWSGRVKTIPVLVSMCRTFRVNVGRLVTEPKSY